MLRFFLGLLLVVAGSLILLTNLGLVDPAATEMVFQALFRLWPALLIVWGISLIFHRQPRLARLLALVVLAAGILLTASLEQAPVRPTGSLAQPVRIPLADEGVPTGARLYLQAGAGRIELVAGSGDLIAGVLEGLVRPVQVATFTPDDSVEVELVQPLPSPLAGLLWPEAASASWQVGLHPVVPWTLDLRLVSAVLDLDARLIPLRQLYLQGDASRLQIRLPGPEAFAAPPEGSLRLRFDLRSSRLELTLPADAGLVLRVRGGGLQPGLTAEGLVRDGDRYISPNFHEAALRYRVDLNLTLATVHLHWEDRGPAAAPSLPTAPPPADRPPLWGDRTALWAGIPGM